LLAGRVEKNSQKPVDFVENQWNRMGIVLTNRAGMGQLGRLGQQVGLNSVKKIGIGLGPLNFSALLASVWARSGTGTPDGGDACSWNRMYEHARHPYKLVINPCDAESFQISYIYVNSYAHFSSSRK
jgi:hypothetical protein